MKRAFAILAFLALSLPVCADDFRVARFDAQRVFNEYQRSKDLNRATLAKVNVGGPASTTPSIERHYKIKDRNYKLSEEIKATPTGSPERERLELQLQLSALELQIDELHRTLESERRGRTLQEEALKQRNEILADIWSAAARLSAERGYRLLIPDNLPAGGPFPSIVVSGATDDLTDQLLKQLNDQYASKNSK